MFLLLTQPICAMNLYSWMADSFISFLSVGKKAECWAQMSSYSSTGKKIVYIRCSCWEKCIDINLSWHWWWIFSCSGFQQYIGSLSYRVSATNLNWPWPTITLQDKLSWATSSVLELVSTSYSKHFISFSADTGCAKQGRSYMTT